MGFNGGSALNTSDGIAAVAIVNTNIAAATAMITWLCLAQLFEHKWSPSGAISGAVVGLVGITPACGYVRPLLAIAIGVITPCFSYFAIKYLKTTKRFSIGDTLDAFYCHGIGGYVGCILTGFFAELKVNPLGHNGLLFGGGGDTTFGCQWLAATVCAVYSFTITFIILTAMKYMPYLRAEVTESLVDDPDFIMFGSPAYSSSSPIQMENAGVKETETEGKESKSSKKSDSKKSKKQDTAEEDADDQVSQS
jgi:Amt family ammonium transporter